MKSIQKASGNHETDNLITLLNLIADPAIVIDEKANFLFMNSTFEKGTGYKNEDWAGKSVFLSDKLTSEDSALLKKKMEKRLQGMNFKPYEISLKNAKNKRRIYELNAKKIDFHFKTAILIIFRDVTSRKLVEQKLKKNSQEMAKLVDKKVKEIEDSAEKIKSIFNSSQDAISFIEPSGRLIDFNNSALKLYGYASRKEVKNLNVFNLLPSREQQRAALSLEALAKTGILKAGQYTLLRKDGQEFPAEVSSSPVRDANGQLIGFVVNTKDISERKKLEDELIASEAKFRAIANSAINARCFG